MLARLLTALDELDATTADVDRAHAAARARAEKTGTAAEERKLRAGELAVPEAAERPLAVGEHPDPDDRLVGAAAGDRRGEYGEGSGDDEESAATRHRPSPRRLPHRR